MSQKKEHTIYTIGHSTRSLEEFIDLLKAFNIQVVVDVRRHPGSRKYPHFNQESLIQSLEKESIVYHHLENLGGRRRVQKNSQNTSWRNASFQGYADFMETDDFKKGIVELEGIALEKTTVFMCSEAVWWSCHRSMISDFLKAKGWDVEHIMGLNNVQEHPYTAPAKIINGELSYNEL